MEFHPLQCKPYLCQKTYKEAGQRFYAPTNYAAEPCLRRRDPARGAQQLVLPPAPLAQLGRAYGVATQVQEHLGALAEALAGKGTRAACDASAVGEELSARRFARTAAKAGA